MILLPFITTTPRTMSAPSNQQNARKRQQQPRGEERGVGAREEDGLAEHEESSGNSERGEDGVVGGDDLPRAELADGSGGEVGLDVGGGWEGGYENVEHGVPEQH